MQVTQNLVFMHGTADYLHVSPAQNSGQTCWTSANFIRSPPPFPHKHSGLFKIQAKVGKIQCLTFIFGVPKIHKDVLALSVCVTGCLRQDCKD